MEDRLFITVWYRVSATLTSRMKGCRAALREPGCGEREAEGRRGLGLNGDERELRRGCLQFPSNFVGNIVTPRSYHLVYGLIPRCHSTLPPPLVDRRFIIAK